MKRALMLVPVLALVLTGCAGATEAEPNPTPTVTESPNADACQDFAEVVSSIPEALNDAENGNEVWEDLRVSFDDVALTADGVVQDRMLALIDGWPDALDVVVWKEFDELNAHFEGVDRACEAEDISVDMPTLTTG